MILKLIFCAIVLASQALGEEFTPGSDQYLLNALSPLLSPLKDYVFDGPARISNAPTKTNKNTLPSLDQMMYYNYYSVAAYFPYDQDDLNCEYCLEFKDDVDYHRGKNRSAEWDIYTLCISLQRVMSETRCKDELLHLTSTKLFQFSKTTSTTHSPLLHYRQHARKLSSHSVAQRTYGIFSSTPYSYLVEKQTLQSRSKFIEEFTLLPCLCMTM